MVDASELDLLRASQADRRLLDVVVTGCAYSCCGRGWHRRDGYEQSYRGHVDNIGDGAFMLYSGGIGTISYVIAARFDEVALVSGVG